MPPLFPPLCPQKYAIKFATYAQGTRNLKGVGGIEKRKAFQLTQRYTWVYNLHICKYIPHTYIVVNERLPLNFRVVDKRRAKLRSLCHKTELLKGTRFTFVFVSVCVAFAFSVGWSSKKRSQQRNFACQDIESGSHMSRRKSSRSGIYKTFQFSLTIFGYANQVFLSNTVSVLHRLHVFRLLIYIYLYIIFVF